MRTARHRRSATRRALLAAAAPILALAACAAPAPTPSAALPPDFVEGAGDPTRSAITLAASEFARPASLVGRPAEAAAAIAAAEYLAVELPTGPRWVSMSPVPGISLQRARAEWRTALGIAPGAPPQAVIDTLLDARRALLTREPARAAAALPPAIYNPGGAATLERLANLPPLPRTAAAASQAQEELFRTQRDDQGDNLRTGPF